MPRRALGAARVVLLAATAVLLITCTDSTTSPSLGGGPTFAVSDGTQPGGNVDVFFLPPLVSAPHGADYGDRPANPDLHPVAKVCTLNATESTPNPGTLACTDSPGDVATLPLTYSPTGEFYQVNWQTGDSHLNTDSMYRIEIFVATVSLAFRDVDPDPGPPRGSCKTTDDFCQFQDGSNLAIKVRIESAAVCLALDPTFDADNEPCATASLGPGGSLALSNLGIATVDEDATINMRLCTDLRERPTMAAGRVDLRTYGECLDIENLEAITVQGTATLCNAFDAALAAGLSPEQAARMTVHRFSLGDDPPVDALPHAAGPDCSTLPPSVGQLPEFNNLEKLFRFAERTWRAAGDQVQTWIRPAPLWANAAAACDRGGCSGSGGFESHYQVAQPAWMTYHPDNPDGDLGTHTVGTTVVGRIQVFDSGELPAPQSPSPHPANDVRLTVTTSSGSVSPTTIYTGPDGVTQFTLTVGPGINTVTVSGIGVGTGDGDGNPVNNVFAPSLNEDPPVAVPVGLEVGTLTFTATGVVPLVFVPDPPTNDLYLTAAGWALLDDFQVCADPRTPGVAITSLVAIKNNGEQKTLNGNLPSFPVVTGADGCYAFAGLTIDGTGAFRLLANGQYVSKKFNVRPLQK